MTGGDGEGAGVSGDRGRDEPFGDRRREFLRKLGGAIGIALAADATRINDLAEAAGKQRRSAIPSGYVWHPVLTASELDGVEDIGQTVMINDRSEVIFHARLTGGGRSVYRMRIGRGRKPGASPPQLIVQTGQTLPGDVVVDRIGPGDTNGAGAYVTVIGGRKDFSSVWVQWPGSGLQQLIGSVDRTPGPGGRYSGHFGDVDIDSKNNVLVVATYTLPGEVHQGLFALPRGQRDGGRLLLRTGQRIPGSRAVLTRLGLVERRGGHFVAQVFGRQQKHLARQDLGSEPSGFLVGRVARGRKGARLLVGSKLLRPVRSAVDGEAFVGPRVDRTGTAATVTHKRSDHLSLHRHKRGHTPARIAHTGNRTRHGRRAETISAPLFGPHGLLYYRAISQVGMELLVVDGNNRRMILETGDKVGNHKVRAINTGWHTDQIDRHGRLAFQAEFEDGSTGIIIGTPV